MLEWISVKDRLPEMGQIVACVGRSGGVFAGEFRFVGLGGKALFYVPNSRTGERPASYWFPLPDAPKKEMRG